MSCRKSATEGGHKDEIGGPVLGVTRVWTYNERADRDEKQSDGRRFHPRRWRGRARSSSTCSREVGSRTIRFGGGILVGGGRTLVGDRLSTGRRGSTSIRAAGRHFAWTDRDVDVASLPRTR